MSSCGASCCMCFPKALSAFATLASSPTGGATLSCPFAFNYSEPRRHHRPNQKPPLPNNPVHSGSVPNVAERWWSSRDLPLPRSNSALHPLSPVSPHDDNSHLAHSVPLTTYRRGAPLLPPNLPPASNLASNSSPDPSKIQPNPSSLSSFFAPLPLLETFLLTPTPFNLHNCLPMGGFLQTAVSDAPRTTWRTYLPSVIGRIRYSTSVSG